MFFSVAADQSEDYDSDDTIKFHHTISNINPGFPGWNPATNMFTCPYDGYYLFMVTIFKYDGLPSYKFNMYAKLRMSDGASFKDVVSVYNSDSKSANVYYSSTMHAIVPCEASQNVWVVTPTSEIRIHDNVFHHNQFSGLLIKEGLE